MKNVRTRGSRINCHHETGYSYAHHCPSHLALPYPLAFPASDEMASSCYLSFWVPLNGGKTHQAMQILGSALQGMQSLYLSLYNQSGGVQTLIPIQTSRIKPAIIYVINAPRYARLSVTWQRIIGYTLGKVFFISSRSLRLPVAKHFRSLRLPVAKPPAMFPCLARYARRVIWQENIVEPNRETYSSFTGWGYYKFPSRTNIVGAGTYRNALFS